MAFWSRWLHEPDLGEALRGGDVEALIQLLPRKQDPLLRIEIIRALAAAADTRAVNVLTAVLGTESNPNVCVAAARALGTLGDVRAVPALVAALDDERRSREVQLRSNDASAYSDARPTAMGSRVVVNRDVQRAAEESLSALGTKAAAPLARIAREMVQELRTPTRKPVQQVADAERLILEGAGADKVDIDRLEQDGNAQELLNFIARLKLHTRLYRPTLR